MLDCKGISTLASSKDKITASNALFSNPTLYRSVVDGLQYLSLTRLEVFFSFHKVSQLCMLQLKTIGLSLNRFCVT